MKNVNYLDCKNIYDCKEKTLSGLAEIYWKEYPEYIRRLHFFLKDCDSYRELGTNQGGSASVAILENLNYYELIDKSFKNFSVVKEHFIEYANNNNINLCFYEQSSLEVATEIKTDFLLVDSVHRYKHVTKEIELYESLTNKYIMFHDTVSYLEVGNAVLDFLKNTKNWKLVEEQTVTPGYIVLKRIK